MRRSEAQTGLIADFFGVRSGSVAADFKCAPGAEKPESGGDSDKTADDGDDTGALDPQGATDACFKAGDPCVEAGNIRLRRLYLPIRGCGAMGNGGFRFAGGRERVEGGAVHARTISASVRQRKRARSGRAFDGDGGRFAAADGVAHGARAAVRVRPVGGQSVLLRRRHRRHGACIVTLRRRVRERRETSV